jgi:putative ABC transport system permease protein
MDDLFGQTYTLFTNLNRAFLALVFFAFTISIIGLIGMASHIAGKRTHEIGVRKTMGASTSQVLAMLLKDFARPVVIANIIAWPFAYMAARVYLNLFVTRIALTPTPFALSLLITLLVARGAVGAQAWRAARVKPAKVLRYE